MASGPAGLALYGRGIAGVTRQDDCPVEQAIVDEVRRLIVSPEMAQIRRAYNERVSLMTRSGGRLIQYEPGLPASAMTLFGENGFVLGPEALASEGELIQTCLHELYRLATSQLGSGGAASSHLAESETQAALHLPSGLMQPILETYDAWPWKNMGGSGQGHCRRRQGASALSSVRGGDFGSLGYAVGSGA